MADCYSRASFIFNLTDEQSIFSLEVANCLLNESFEDIKDGQASNYATAVIEVALAYIKRLDDFNEQCLGFAIQLCNEGLWFSHEEDIEFENVAIFIQTILKYFDLDFMVCFEGCNNTTNKQIDGFSGVACAITKDNINWLSTRNWLSCQKKAHENNLI